MAPVDNTVMMEGVRIIYRNFAGREGQYNQEGDRNFSVVLEEDVAKRMEQDGWSVRWPKPREDFEEEDTRLPTLAVSLKYRGRNGREVRPPKIVMISSRGRNNLGEDECELLDWADIVNVDLIIRPYEWSVGGRGGIKAYVQSMFVTIREDALELKYADIEPVPHRGPRPVPED